MGTGFANDVVTKNQGGGQRKMYGHNTLTGNGLGTRDKQFQRILERAAGTIQTRLKRYDSNHDPLKRSHLKLLWDIVMIEAERVAAGESKLYTGLESPLKAVTDWGEPPDSDLTSSLLTAERFYRENYRAPRGITATRMRSSFLLLRLPWRPLVLLPTHRKSRRISRGMQ
jgi:hypothetical protein